MPKHAATATRSTYSPAISLGSVPPSHRIIVITGDVQRINRNRYTTEDMYLPIRIVVARIGDVSKRSRQRRSFSIVIALAENAGDMIDSSTNWLWPKM